jgi:hypothetical protein
MILNFMLPHCSHELCCRSSLLACSIGCQLFWDLMFAQKLLQCLTSRHFLLHRMSFHKVGHVRKYLCTPYLHVCLSVEQRIRLENMRFKVQYINLTIHSTFTYFECYFFQSYFDQQAKHSTQRKHCVFTAAWYMNMRSIASSAN